MTNEHPPEDLPDTLRSIGDLVREQYPHADTEEQVRLANERATEVAKRALEVQRADLADEIPAEDARLTALQEAYKEVPDEEAGAEIGRSVQSTVEMRVERDNLPPSAE